MKPDPQRNRLQQKQQEQSGEIQQTGQQQTGREFASVEEMLRYDARQVKLPESIASRLQESIKKDPELNKPWWKRFFS